MIEIYYRILKHDPEGRLVKDTGLIPSHSYVIQFLELIEALFDGPTDREATGLAGTEVLIYQATATISGLGKMSATVGELKGIVVGTNDGTTAEDNEDYDLDTRILHSAVGEAGKMNYQATFLTAAGVVGPNVDFEITRSFLNETGSTITVKEIGLITVLGAAGRHLILRDVVSDEDVLDNYTLTVIYTFRTTA